MATATTQHVIYPKEFQTSYRDSREKNIVIAASRVFIESGFDNASMDDIAIRANVSKRTIYNRYASKQDVFDVAIIYACQEYSRLSLKLCFKTPIAEFLENTGYQILEHRTRPEVLALRRLILFQSASMPGLSEVFFKETLSPIVNFISEYLDQMSALGHITIENPMKPHGIFIISFAAHSSVTCSWTRMANKTLVKHFGDMRHVEPQSFYGFTQPKLWWFRVLQKLRHWLSFCPSLSSADSLREQFMIHII